VVAFPPITAVQKPIPTLTVFPGVFGRPKQTRFLSIYRNQSSGQEQTIIAVEFWHQTIVNYWKK
jgi:hypothetical protein